MSTKLRPGQKIKLKSVEELLGVSNEESAMDIEIVKIRPFKNHPFKVVDDDKMQDLVESIRANGILSPVLIRPIGNDIYEMVSGHRRMHAAAILGMECVLQAVGTLLVGIGGVVLKAAAVLMFGAAGLLFFISDFSGLNALVVILLSTVMFWLPELFALMLVGLAFLQGKIADTFM